MAAANQHYHSKVAIAIRVIATQEAKREVKRRLQAAGQKPQYIEAKVISAMAQALLEERREEFIAKAKASKVVQEAIEEERRKLERKSKHMRNSTERCVAGTSVAQNSCSQGIAR